MRRILPIAGGAFVLLLSTIAVLPYSLCVDTASWPTPTGLSALKEEGRRYTDRLRVENGDVVVEDGRARLAGDLRNTGSRGVLHVTLVVSFLDGDGRPIREGTASWRAEGRPQEPLAPGGTLDLPTSLGDLYPPGAPSGWAGPIEVRAEEVLLSPSP